MHPHLRNLLFAPWRTAWLFGLLVVGAAWGAQPLPSFDADIAQTSASGLSSGGFMAVQFHVAHSSIMKGVGVIAGGPYFCAKDNQTTATAVCSCTGFGACHVGDAIRLVPDLVQATNQNAQQGAIDPTSHLSSSRVWLFSGTLDSVVPPPVMDALETYYRAYVPAAGIRFKKDIPAEHAMPTGSFGSPCNFRGDPYINDCNFDAAGELLQWIYGPLNAKSGGALGGQFVEFDQSAFLPAPTSHGMSLTGWVYVPAACRQSAHCRVHVVLHGCRQYPASTLAGGPQGRFGDTYVKNAGYNGWADTNRIIVLYPQANAMTVGTRLPRSNPNGCWDWWGYDDANYAKKAGRQMTAIRAMVDRLAGLPTTPPPTVGFCGTASNAAHAAADRASSWFGLWYFARGSNDFLGFSVTPTTLRETSTGVFESVIACS